MGKRSTGTPRYKVRSALRALWLRSRERSTALKLANYSCQVCGKKQSKAKGREVAVEVHHDMDNMNWEGMIDLVYEYLLCDPAKLVCLCKSCHDAEHAQKQGKFAPQRDGDENTGRYVQS